VPVAGIALILGIDRFMSEARALTNLIGNGVATIVVSKWCGELDTATLDKELAQGATPAGKNASATIAATTSAKAEVQHG
jgi:aerobic C4-dicarboxylate transport protein